MKRLTLIVLGLIASFAARADEGMWLPTLICQRIADMKDNGCKLTAKDIYDINQASLKDAVVQFGRGCTGELISSEGLLLTNHHCGYGQIQKHSSVEHDYLRDGFWAMNRNEELPNEGLTVSILERMEDVTDRILKGCNSQMDESQRQEVIEQNIRTLTDSIDKNGRKVSVEALYYGNQYFLFIYRVYEDVRLVGAPPSSIGKFGGDTDNWMWPRHTGDFSIFRVYADKDNNPAPYSKDNVPYRPKKHLEISTKGVNEGDFTMVYGFPGRTQEYLHSEGVRYIEETGDPQKIALRTIRLNIMGKYMQQSQKVRIQYSSKHAGVANAWKKWQGEVKGLKKMKTVTTKQAYEKEFAAWAKGGEFDGVTEKLAELYMKLEPYAYATDYYNESVRAIELPAFAMNIARLFSKGNDGNVIFDKAKAEKLAEDFYRDYHQPIDKEIFIALMHEYDKNVNEGFKTEYFKNCLKEHQSIERWADYIFSNSIFTDSRCIAALTAEDKEKVATDPATEFLNEFLKWYHNDIIPVTKVLNQDIQLAYRDYMRGQMVYSRTQRKARDFYPDANFTLRVAYGHVKGYSPADGIYYIPNTTIEGIMQKDNPEIFDYNIPQVLRDAYAEKDYGRWVNKDGQVPVCFLATNHTTGGNSGSPVLNAKGQLIGLNFDRVWEGTMSDLVFDPEICRNIALDIRYVLFTIEKIGGAGYLLDEMTIK